MTTRPLVVRIRNWVGDVILGLPALRLLEAQGYALHIVARGRWAPALLAGYDWPVHVQPPEFGAKLRQLRELRADCRRIDAGFDRRENALLLPVSFSSALEMKLAGLRAVGVAKEGRSPLLARAEPWLTEGHEALRYWDVARRFLRVEAPMPADIEFKVAPAGAETAARLLAAAGIDGPYIVICPFAAGRAARADRPQKKWPAFAEFARLAPQRLGMPLVIYPGPGEHEEARALYPQAVVIEGSDLTVYAALLQRAALVVANDTGPAHLAAAVGRPLISVLGPTDAPRWAPWGTRTHVLQKLGNGTTTATATVWPDAEEGLALALRLLGGAT